MSRLRDLISLVRAPAALSVPGDAIAGASAAGTLGPATGGLAAASVCLYWAGMAANDWADRDLDAVERPERPIPSGRVRPGTALGVAAGLTAAGLGLAALAGGRRSLAVAAPLAAAIWIYDLYAKSTVAGPGVMAACRGLDVLLGATAGGSEHGRGIGGRVRAALPAAAVVAAHTYTLTELSRREVSGATTALPATTLTATAGVAAAALTRAGKGAAPRTLVAGALVGEYLARFGGAQVKALNSPDGPRVRAAVGAGITALPALQGALAARFGAAAAGLTVAAAAPVARHLVRKVSAT
jgi:4-hydroxybenzoate polyprenyltransferase